MLTKHRNALRSARTELLRSVRVDELLLSELISKHIIGIPLKQEIMVSNRHTVLKLVLWSMYHLDSITFHFYQCQSGVDE